MTDQPRRDRSYISRDEFEVFEKNVDRSFQSVTDALRGLERKMDQLGSTDWKTLGMFAGLILSVVSLGSQPFRENIERLQNKSGGHASWIAEHDRIVSALNATQNERLKAMETLLIPDIRDLQVRLREAEAELRRRGAILEKIEREQERRTAKVYSDQ